MSKALSFDLRERVVRAVAEGATCGAAARFGSARRVSSAGARLLYPPPYSPDFNPIENAFAKLKALLHKAAARNVKGLWSAIGAAVDAFIPQECANYFAAAGYDTDAA
jgi:transposase